MPSNLDDLERLARLRESGMLTAEEYDAQKAALLSAPAARAAVHSPQASVPAATPPTSPSHFYPGQPTAWQGRAGAPQARRSRPGPILTIIGAVVLVGILIGGYLLFFRRPYAHTEPMHPSLAAVPVQLRGTWEGTGDCAGSRLVFGSTTLTATGTIADIPAGNHTLTNMDGNDALFFFKMDGGSAVEVMGLNGEGRMSITAQGKECVLHHSSSPAQGQS